MTDKVPPRKPLEVSGLRARPSRRRWPWLFVPMLAAGGYVGAKMATDPGRAWAARVSVMRHDVLEAPFAPCFGSAESSALRAAAEQVRAQHPAPGLASCKGPTLEALASAASRFAAQLPAPPTRASTTHTLEVQALKELGRSLGRLQSVLESTDNDAATRDRASRTLLEVAALLDQERTAFARTTDAARAFKLW